MTLATKPKPPKHHKKVTGKHHRKHSKHYAKPYWPYLPLLLIVGIGLAVNALWSHQTGVLGYATDMSVQALLADTNAKRVDHQESLLKLNSRLTAAAQAKADDMAKRNYWAHNAPDGKTPWSFITKSGYAYQRAGENLAYGFPDAASTITGWMNSSEHRANILNGAYSEVGFGIVDVPNFNHSGPETLVVAMYAQPAAVTAAAASSSSHFQQTEPVTAKSNNEPTQQRVARIQLLTAGSAPWSLFAISALTAVAVLLFMLRHGFIWRRALAKSEIFIVHHPLLDIAVISLATIGYVLSQTTGIIR